MDGSIVHRHGNPGHRLPLKPGPGRSLWFTNRGVPTIGRMRIG